MATIDQISIKIEADVNTALQNLRKVQKAAGDTEKALGNIKDDVRVDIKADTKAALSSIRTLEKSLGSLKSVDAGVDIDVGKAQQQLRALRQQLLQFRRGNGEIPITANINDALRQLRTLENAINRVEDGADIDVRANTSAAQAALQRLGRNVETDLIVNTGRARADIGRFTRGATLQGRGLLDIFATVTGGIGGGGISSAIEIASALQTRAAARSARVAAQSAQATTEIFGKIVGVDDILRTAADGTGKLTDKFLGLSTVAGRFGTVAAGVGVGIGATVVAAGALAVVAGNTYNQFQLVDSGLQAVSKSSLDYATASGLATEAQRLLGGSLGENVETLRQLQLLANTTGAPLKDLLDTALLLSVTNPAQGIEGAGVAIRELLSGDTTSLVERFNIPRGRVNAIRDLLFPEEGAGISSVEALTLINQLIAEQGVTLATVEARTNTNAAATERLAAAWERALLAAGKFPGAVLGGAADALAGVIDGVTEALQFPQLAETVDLLGRAEDYAAYAAEVERIGIAQAGLTAGGIGGQITPENLTEAEFEYIRVLETRGLTAEQAYKQFAQLSEEQRANIEAEIAAVYALQQAEAEAARLRVQQNLAFAELAQLLRATGQLSEEQAKKREELDRRLAQSAALDGEARQRALAGIARDFGISYEQGLKLLALQQQLSQSPYGFSLPGFVQIAPRPGAPTAVKPPRIPAPVITGGGGKSKSEQEAEDLERLRQRILEAERRYRKELLKIEADYYKRSNQARVVFGDQQFSSRASFYDRLAQFEDQGVRKTLSAQYEQAQIEAGKISDQFGGDVAERFLQASEDAILARAQRQLGIQTAEAEGRFGDAEYLRGVDNLYRTEEDRRIERSKNTEDSIASDRNAAVTDAAESYRDTLEGFITGEEKKLAAVTLVNDALREQGLLGSTSVISEGGAITLNVQSTQLDDIKKSIDALALRLPVGV